MNTKKSEKKIRILKNNGSSKKQKKSVVRKSKEEPKITNDERIILEKMKNKQQQAPNQTERSMNVNKNNIDLNQLMRTIAKNPMVKRDLKSKIWAAFWALLLVSFFSYLIISSLDLQFGNVALIPVNGEIVYNGGYNEASATQIVKWLDDANSNNGIKAIVLDINSPGGSADASYLIMNKVKHIKKPVVAIIHEIGTSGAYWIASASSKIFANKLSMTGSIGVYASYLSFANLLKRLNITYEQLTAGKFKDMGSPYTNLTEEERTLLMQKINRTYEIFVNSVAQNRNLSVEKVLKIANGQFYLAQTAQKLGLIDEIGTMSDVKKYLLNITGEQVSFVKYQSKPSFFDKISSLMSSFSVKLGNSIGSSFAKEMSQSKIFLN